MPTLDTINPANGSAIKSWETMEATEVDAILEAASRAWGHWRTLDFDERAARFHRLADLLHERQDTLAMLMTQEMGKPITQAQAECEKCAWVCQFFADHAAALLTDETIDVDGHQAITSYRPLGVIYAVMPWNLPLWQVFRAAAPTMMAGNGMVLKHAPNVLGCAEAIEMLFRDAGFPKDLFRSLVIDIDLSPRVIAHDVIRGVTLTGSGRAGQAVASQAGTALKKSVMELGGSDPYLVFEDADLDLAADACVASRMLANGQVCIAAKRLIIVQPVLEEFTMRVIERMKTWPMADPTTPECRLGPLAREDLRDHHHDQVMRSVKSGAICLMGGTVPDQAGWWYPATVLTNVTPGMPAFEEELFGPTAVLIQAKDEDEAVELANQSRFGLGGAVFTQDLDRGRALARDQIHVGSCAVNGFVSSDPRLPFGGIGDSGYGRELGAPGIHEFVNIKTIVVA
ncbi:MAG: NAD-dependent succinate-semialdehyde dehydrogenase [Planctomycetota bacterium]|nr:NAD-dependent succinate-semialdehyde dehydrogenase [Planctomycetota bacterium]